MNLRVKFFLTLGVLWLSMASGVAAQTTEADIAARLVGKPLLLRGFWAEDKLRFHADGTAAKTYKVRPFTESAIDITSVKLSGHDLTLDGQRVGLLFDKAGNVTRVPLVQGRGFDKWPEKMRIEVEGPSNGDFTRTLDAVFAEGLADMAATLPEAWQPYAREHILHEEPPPGQKNFLSGPLSTDDKALRIGGGVKPPRVLHSVDPEFSEVARKQRISGSVMIYLQVGPSGEPDHMRIARPMGLGLDERALAAVSQYRFAPATQDGKPVRVELYIDVNFQIF